ncbi:unnamed protein product [Linum tenue]|uniref:Uncharacterized protein n=1 Tax=Linum tenue TaxID=586396 RepID=A0AAV0GXE5_9ROSI|nr:unnamed protein product [Linum tenue]CAI0377056.1 unnamed protein product [Linum tenue]
MWPPPKPSPPLQLPNPLLILQIPLSPKPSPPLETPKPTHHHGR